MWRKIAFPRWHFHHSNRRIIFPPKLHENVRTSPSKMDLFSSQFKVEPHKIGGFFQYLKFRFLRICSSNNLVNGLKSWYCERCFFLVEEGDLRIIVDNDEPTSSCSNVSNVSNIRLRDWEKNWKTWFMRSRIISETIFPISVCSSIVSWKWKNFFAIKYNFFFAFYNYDLLDKMKKSYICVI